MPHLYVIRSPSGRRKIGYTVNLPQRMRMLELSSSLHEHGEFTCEFTADCDAARMKVVEAHAHAMLWHRRIKGEWFWIDLDMARDAIAAAQAAAETGTLLPRPEWLGKPGLWRGEGCHDPAPRTEEWFAAQDVERKERDCVAHLRRCELAKARWERRRNA